MEPDLWHLYALMLRSRLFEELIDDLWHAGHISGEMHMSVGEEGIAAGVLDHVQEGDALALDHRGTAPLIMRGVSARDLLAEMLGRPDGLCAGQGGHMHLYSKDHLAASSGIVGAAGPAAAGFALAGQMLRPGSIAVAFFGEGALNQGMLLESLNLTAVWNLPVLFVCKDDGWAIFTPTENTTRTSPVEKARGFGITAVSVDGSDVLACWRSAGSLIQSLRDGEGPAFLHATCIRPHAHFLGDPLLRTATGKRSLGLGTLLRSLTRIKGDSLGSRARAGADLAALMRRSVTDRDMGERDPLQQARQKLADLDKLRLENLEDKAARSIAQETAALLEELEAAGERR